MSDLYMQHVAEGLRERIAKLDAENAKLRALVKRTVSVLSCEEEPSLIDFEYQCTKLMKECREALKHREGEA